MALVKTTLVTFVMLIDGDFPYSPPIPTEMMDDTGYRFSLRAQAIAPTALGSWGAVTVYGYTGTQLPGLTGWMAMAAGGTANVTSYLLSSEIAFQERLNYVSSGSQRIPGVGAPVPPAAFPLVIADWPVSVDSPTCDVYVTSAAPGGDRMVHSGEKWTAEWEGGWVTTIWRDTSRSPLAMVTMLEPFFERAYVSNHFPAWEETTPDPDPTDPPPGTIPILSTPRSARMFST